MRLSSRQAVEGNGNLGSGGRRGLGGNRVTGPCSTNTIQDFYTVKATQYNASIVSGWPVKEFQLKIPVNIYAIHSGHSYFFEYLYLHCISI